MQFLAESRKKAYFIGTDKIMKGYQLHGYNSTLSSKRPGGIFTTLLAYIHLIRSIQMPRGQGLGKD